MGQRTQIYIADFNPAQTYPDVPEHLGEPGTIPNPRNHGDRTRLSMYHNQWGYGCRMLLDAAGLFLTTRKSRIETEPQILGTHLCCENDFINERGDWEYTKKHCEVDATALCRPFAESANDWRKMVDFGDNNNGICVIYRQIDDFGNIEKAEVLFLRGWEETPKNEREEPAKILTAAEYLAQYREEEENAQALKIWNAVCEAFQVKEFTGK